MADVGCRHRIYLSGPLFSAGEIAWGRELSSFLRERLANAGVQVIWPYELSINQLEPEEILGRARNVQVWLQKYAPKYVKFQLQETLPAAVNNLSPAERQALGLLAGRIEDKTAAEIHDLVYVVAKEMNLDSKKFFQAIYLTFLGDRQGPKVGWFLASLDRDFVRSRLAAAASPA